jgi:3-hydroxybutyryl-CoA dehydratase
MSAPPPLAGLAEGARASHPYTISAAVYEHFLAAFGDTNPLHTDDAFARRHGFPGRVMHGMILNGFVSHFVGMRFPGPGALLHVVSTQFKSPCHVGDVICIDATVTQVVEAVATLTMELVLTNVTRNRVAAKAKVQVGVL